MNIVFVSRSKSGKPHPFIEEQADVLKKNHNVEIHHFLIRLGGIKGYLKAVIQLHKYIKERKIDIIHVHYGLWSLIAVISKFIFLKKYKIVITFHGSDINKMMERGVSLLGAKFSSYNILVSEKMLNYFKKSYSLIPCGIDTTIALNFRECARKEKGWTESDFVVLFSSNFDRKVKDPEFAFKVINAFKETTSKSVKFIELKGFTRDQLINLMQAADVLLMCSKTEGSPQVIKEAIVNALPVISNDVGDVRSICSGVDHCFIVEKKVEEYVKCLQALSEGNERVQNRQPVIEKFDNNLVSEKLFNIYNTVLSPQKVNHFNPLSVLGKKNYN